MRTFDIVLHLKCGRICKTERRRNGNGLRGAVPWREMPLHHCEVGRNRSDVRELAASTSINCKKEVRSKC
jgi:hypothetical protein